MEMKKNTWIIIVAILAAILIGVGIYSFMTIKEKNQIIEDQVALEDIKMEDLNNELNALTIQYEGFQQTLSSDSLLSQLEIEKQRVRNLQEELKTIKASDTKRIRELESEIKTLRKIMYSYIVQIDSLNQVNIQLVKEKEIVTQQYQEAAAAVSQLSQKNEQLTETVQIASKLDASNITVRTLNKKNKEKKKIKDLARLEFGFTINKNITAEPGVKTVYIRIMKPDNDILYKSTYDIFHFEGKGLIYSAKRDFEYSGEEVRMNVYWEIDETLLPGEYRVDIFADGNIIGQKTFTLNK